MKRKTDNQKRRENIAKCRKQLISVDGEALKTFKLLLEIAGAQDLVPSPVKVALLDVLFLLSYHLTFSMFLFPNLLTIHLTFMDTFEKCLLQYLEDHYLPASKVDVEKSIATTIPYLLLETHYVTTLEVLRVFSFPGALIISSQCVPAWAFEELLSA